MLKIRRAKLLDIDGIMPIIYNAQKYLAAQDIDQWQNSFPNENVIKNDIQNAEAYVICDGETLAAYFAFFTPPEPAYKNIENGRWLIDTENYCAMHHVAVSGDYRGRGLAHMIYKKCEERAREGGFDSLRVDTHEDNKIMRHTAEANGFVYCGVVYYNENMKRIAFEKSLL
jgi:GNAT superfamily N-acetyltransferase